MTARPRSSAAGAAAPVIEIEALAKTFRAPLSRRRVEAVRGVSLAVHAGEVFGFLGPNGAGKTTTIRILMGLVAASAGRASIFGRPVPSRAARARLGFLPEQPYFYSYLSVAEMLDLTGRLCGMARRERRRRADELIERVGLSHARGLPMVKFSKGMLQRAGIAQALIHDPELVVLDEPMSGLDPVGRADVIDILHELRARGVTVFFSSHILSDVEQICDRVAILDRGLVREAGPLDELLGEPRGADATLAVPAGADLSPLRALCEQLSPEGGERGAPGDGEHREIRARLGAGADIDEFVVAAHALGARVRAIAPRRLTLEQLFIQRVGKARGAGDPTSQAGTAAEAAAQAGGGRIGDPTSQAAPVARPDEQGEPDERGEPGGPGPEPEP